MKLVQIGILAALVAVGALLFMVYRGQQQQQPVTAETTTGTPSPADSVQTASPSVDTTPARTAAESRPSPAAVDRRAAKAAAASAQSAETPATRPQSDTAVAASAPPANPVRSEPPPPPKPRTVTIESGTLIAARLGETISTEKAQTGDTFTATLDKPLVIDGMTVAERGARVEGRVEEAVQAGRVRGLASLSIRLVRLHTADGQQLEIQTDAFHQEGESTKARDAAKVGGGAGIGAAIGAIAGGGKGAAIGAAIGGAAGAGTVAATRGKPAVLPVETRIDFRVSQPITVTEQR